MTSSAITVKKKEGKILTSALTGTKFRLKTISKANERFINTFVKYGGVGYIEIDLRFPWTYVQALERLDELEEEKDGYKISSYLTRLVMEDIERRCKSDPELTRKYAIGKLSKDERKFFLDDFVYDANYGRLSSHDDENFSIEIEGET